eukprot:4480732-Amphidinium_carterae.2
MDPCAATSENLLLRMVKRGPVSQQADKGKLSVSLTSANTRLGTLGLWAPTRVRTAFNCSATVEAPITDVRATKGANHPISGGLSYETPKLERGPSHASKEFGPGNILLPSSQSQVPEHVHEGVCPGFSQNVPMPQSRSKKPCVIQEDLQQ